MNIKKKLAIACLAANLAIPAAYAQLAKKEGITLEEIGKELGDLAEKKDTASRNRLAFEAKALASSNEESFVQVAVKIYAFMGDKAESERISNSIVKRFPKGNKARQEGYQEVFNYTTGGTAAIEKAYKAWLKKFPETPEEAGGQSIYSQALMELALVFYRDNNAAKGDTYVAEAKQRRNFAQYANWLGSKLLGDKNYEAALPVLASGYDVAAAASQSADPAIKTSNDARSYVILAQNYVKVLEVKSMYPELADMLAYFVNSPFGGITENALKLGNAYLKQGRKLDAFLAFDSYLKSPRVQGRDEKVIAAAAPLYQELNNGGNYDVYIASIRSNVDNVLTTKFKTEMVKRAAPDFSLTDLSGNTVSLADLKGKVVVLEFWATWCSPCKRSLPGMQALVNKYKNDNEVVFLFVDVFQKENNFKELVQNFVTSRNYTFHVVLDEMRNPSKSAARAYGVNGIPHKVVIDKKGMIRFEGTGDLADPEKTVNELSAKIELARKG